MQTQTSNTFHNAIMEAGSKDRPLMLAPGNYVQWKSRIKRYIDTKPNHELIHYCLTNPPYELGWIDKEILISEGSPITRSERFQETYKNVLQEILDACPNACEMWKAIERLKQGESINVQDLETNLYWEFGKFTYQDGDVSPGVDGPPVMPEDPYAYVVAAFQSLPPPDYVPGPEETEQAPPSPVYIPYVPKPMYPEYIPPEDDVFPVKEQPLPAAALPTAESPGYILEFDLDEDPEEDDDDDHPADYPTDHDDEEEEEENPSRDDVDEEQDEDDDNKKEEHPSLTDSIPPPPALCVTARISFRPQPPTLSFTKEDAERLLAMPIPPPSPLTPLSSPLQQIPSPPLLASPPILPIPLHVASLPYRYEARESSVATLARPIEGRRADYGFVDSVKAEIRRRRAKDIRYGIKDTWIDPRDVIEEEALTTFEGVNTRVTELAAVQEQDTQDIYRVMEDTQGRQMEIFQRVKTLVIDNPDITIEEYIMYEMEKALRNNQVYDWETAKETVGSTTMQKSGIQCYNCKEFRHVARECQKPKREKDAAYHREKMLLCKQEEAGIQLNAEQADWRDDTDDDELEDQELEAYYIYPINKDAHNVIIDPLDMSYEREEINQNDDDYDLENEQRSRLSHTSVNNGNSEESFNKQTTLLEKRMDESISLDKKCQSSIEIFKVKTYVNTIINRVELCKEKIANRTYSGYIDPFIQKTIEAKFSPVISRINAGLEQFHMCLNEEMVADLRYFNSLELEDLKAQLQDKGIVIRVIPTTSVSRPQPKSNSIGDRVMRNNSQGKNKEVEDQRRNVKFSKNKTSVTACNDSLNAKTLNVNSLCATCETYVLNDKHNMCVLNSVAKPLKKTVALESNQKPKNITRKLYERLIEIILFIVESRCSKHMTGNLKLLINFVEKFLGMVKFGNDQIAPILGYGDLVQGAVTIKRGNDLLTCSRGTDLYSITLQDTDSPNPICLMARATSYQAWLWYRRLSHLNFDTINLMSKNDIVVGLSKLKFVKDHLCSSYHVSSDPAPECQRMALEHDSLSPTIQRQVNVPQADRTVTTSNELDLLFSLMFDELLNESSKVVSKTFAVCSADAPNQHQQHTTPLNNHTTPAPTCQVSTLASTVTSSENINQAETYAENDQVADDEFINIFYTPIQDQGETSSQQVIGNPSQSVRPRCQLESDAEMCMFALTISRTEPKNIKEAMADSAWIESMQEELHQFDRLEEEVYVNQPDGFVDPYHPDKVYRLKKAILLVQIYVDDIIFGSTNPNISKRFEKLMHSKFEMSMMGELKFFLGIQIHQSPRVADLSGTPIDQTKYRSKVGALMYLTASRPDIMHATCYCARYQAQPTEKHLTAVKRIFWYLKYTIHMRLWYLKDTDFELTAFSDSDHAGCFDSRKSTSGGIQFLFCDKLVSWLSNKQDCTSTSFAEVEYVSLSACCAQVLWMRTQLTDYDFYFDKIPIYHFIKEKVEKGIVELFFVGIEYQLADLFTKALPEERFKYLVRRLVMRCLTPAELEALVNESA
uniref:CCHC-type domain-containing protein n=1 Tax=Tanacetum cinerariifolium TaxID=118510 RepID=A0A6L2MRE2_TANCI|nr:hypothetical protein [Tanacetum cinerariifolium]